MRRTIVYYVKVEYRGPTQSSKMDAIAGAGEKKFICHKTASDFVICYSVKPSCTNVALVITKERNVDIYNLGDEKTLPVEKHTEIFDVLAKNYQFEKKYMRSCYGKTLFVIGVIFL